MSKSRCNELKPQRDVPHAQGANVPFPITVSNGKKEWPGELPHHASRKPQGDATMALACQECIKGHRAHIIKLNEIERSIRKRKRHEICKQKKEKKKI